MILIEKPAFMQEWSQKAKSLGKTIALVPTMGFLHEGHLSLLQKGRALADKLVLSIFVNPLQFGPGEDLKRYPRNVEKDLEIAKECDVDAVFIPDEKAVYPKGFQTTVSVEELSKPLCGIQRPHHFQGVATVVLKLFHIIRPDFALFGEKDFQQLKIIQRMVHDLNLPVQVVGMPIVREVDGLAKSSRNQYLSTQEREAALSISLSLAKAQAMVDRGEKNISALLQTVQATLEETEMVRVEYIHIVDPETLDSQQTFLKKPALLAIACHIGKTRLIDNCFLK